MKISIKYKDKNFELLNVINTEDLLKRIERISGLTGVTLANLGFSDEEKIADGMSYELKPGEIQYIKGVTYITTPEGNQTNPVIMNKFHRYYPSFIRRLYKSGPFNMRDIHTWLDDIKELHLPGNFTDRQTCESLWRRLSQCMMDYSHVKIIFPPDIDPIDSSVFNVALSVFSQFNALSVFVRSESDAKMVRKSIKANHHFISHLTLQAFNAKRNIRSKPLMNSLLGLGLQSLTLEYVNFRMNDSNSKALEIFLSESKSLREFKISGINKDLLQFTGWLDAIIKNPLLTHLSLIGRNSYGLNEKFITALANVLNTCPLETLRIAGLELRDKEIKFLESQITDNHLLRDLYLHSCEIQCFDSILQKFPALTKLNLTHNLMTNSGLKKLIQRLPGLTVTALDLSYNKITSTDNLREFLPILPLRTLQIDAKENYSLMSLSGSLTAFESDGFEEKVMLRNRKLIPILTNFLTHLFKIIDQNIFPQMLLKIIIEYWSEDIIKARFANSLNLFFSALVASIGYKGWDLSENKHGFLLYAGDALKTQQTVIYLQNLLNKNAIKANYTVNSSDNIEIDIALEEIFKFYIRAFQDDSKAQTAKTPSQYTHFEKIFLFHRNQILPQPIDEKPVTGCTIA